MISHLRRLLTSFCLLLLLALVASAAPQTVSDDQLYSFDDGIQPFYHGAIDGAPVSGSF
jgi:hypothetical protein